MQPIERVAEYVHLLPASQGAEFRGAGGLFRLSLEVAFHSLQAAAAVLFGSVDSVSQRRELEPRWRYACFIAGLCAEIYRPVSKVIVVNASGDDQWQPFAEGLAKWGRSRGHSRYFIRWQSATTDDRALASLVIAQLAPPESMSFVGADKHQIWSAILASVSGTSSAGDAHLLQNIVTRTSITVIERDRRANPELYGKVTLGVHLERYFIDAIRQLLRTETLWTVNLKKGRVWWGSDGLFLVYPIAIKDIVAHLAKDNLPGIPQSADTVLEVLRDAKIVTVAPSGQSVFTIQNPFSGKDLMAIRLAHAELFLDALSDSAAESLQHNLSASLDVANKRGAPVEPQGKLALTAPPAVNNVAPSQWGELEKKEPFAFPQCDPAVRGALENIAEVAASDPNSRTIFPLAGGIAVALAAIHQRNINPTRAVAALEACGWLAPLPDNKRILTHCLDGANPLQVLVLNSAASVALGL